MKIYEVIKQLVETSKYKYSDSITLELRGDFKFELVKQKECIRLIFTGSKQVYAVHNLFKFGLSISGIKFYPDRYIIEVDGWKDVEISYDE